MNSLHRLLNCEIGGLNFRVITTEYRTCVHCLHMYHLFVNALVRVIYSVVSGEYSYTIWHCIMFVNVNGYRKHDFSYPVKDKINLNATLSLISLDVHDLISMRPDQLFDVFYETRPAVQCFLWDQTSCSMFSIRRDQLFNVFLWDQISCSMFSMRPDQLFNVFYETRPAVQCFLWDETSCSVFPMRPDQRFNVFYETRPAVQCFLWYQTSCSMFSMRPDQLFNVFHDTRPAVQCFLWVLEHIHFRDLHMYECLYMPCFPPFVNVHQKVGYTRVTFPCLVAPLYLVTPSPINQLSKLIGFGRATMCG